MLGDGGVGWGTRRIPLPPHGAFLRLCLLPLICFFCAGLCRGRDDAIGIKCIEREREALLAVRADISLGAAADKWLFHDCCRWKGVKCDNHSGHVVKLDLSYPYSGWPASPSKKSKVSPALLNLTSLRHLDLSYNDFGGAPMPDFIGSLVHLEYLNLSHSRFAGSVPPQLGSLRNLRALDLSSSSYGSLKAQSLRWLSYLTHLQYLDITWLDLSAVTDWLHVINMLPSLFVLRLHGCGPPNLPTTLPHVNFTSLSTLDLSFNYFNSTWPLWLFNLTSLIELDLSYDLLLHGPIPDGFGNLKHLEVLSLSGNQFEGVIPGSLWTLDSLKYLYLWGYNLRVGLSQHREKLSNLQELELYGVIGRLPDSLVKLQRLKLSSSTVELPVSLGNLSHLESLHLSYNSITGGISESLGNLVNLKVLNFFGNRINGGMPESLRNLSHLESLSLQYNNISGGIPESLGNLVNLKDLSLESNHINGGIPESIGNLSHLESLSLHSNDIIGGIPESLGNLVNLKHLTLSDNNIDGRVSESLVNLSHLESSELPKSVGNLVDLRILRLSRFNISQEGLRNMGRLCNLTDLAIYDCIGEGVEVTDLLKGLSQCTGGLESLFLRGNGFGGHLPEQVGQLDNLEYLSLSDNKLSGLVPSNIGKLCNLTFLDLSSNSFEGSIPLSICQLKGLLILDLSYNYFSDVIPGCWEKNNSMFVMKLSHNHLVGPIPSSLGILNQLAFLHLDKNNFTGVIPSSLKYSTHLLILDFSHNKLSGEIPTWLGESLSLLHILRLRSNMFHGNIPMSLSQLQSLQILDLACNRLSGTLLLSFHNLSAMINIEMARKVIYSNVTGAAYFLEESVSIVPKGIELEYTKTLSLVTIIDLSDNNLSGHIPEEITSLSGLRFLNLSGNHIDGQIPTNIGTMSILESLDLSFNQLSGNIPLSMSNMNFLSRFNVSYNNLSEKIPSGNQLQTFDQSSYIGNPGLCGAPLLRRCSNDVTSRDPIFQASDAQEAKHESYMTWLYIGMGTGFAAGFWGFLGVLLLMENKRVTWFHFIDFVADKLYVMVVVHFARLKLKISS